jgi:hypothetical protein
VRAIRRAGGALLLAGALAACDAPRPAPPKLFTLFDVKALYDRGAQGSDAIATAAGLPGGVAIGSLLDPMNLQLAVQRSWAESYATAYATTEVWAGFPEIWLQPMYVPIHGWKDGVPQRVLGDDGNAHPIFSVGPKSAFYSPFWQVFYVDVPPEIVDGSLTSVRQVLAAGHPVYPSGGSWVAALSPEPLILDPAATTDAGAFAAGTGWLDGAPIDYARFPGAPFGWNADGVVTEVPIFHFVFPDRDGNPVAPAIPTVMGTGPLFSRTPPPLDAMGRRSGKYSAYWRVYTVTLPPAARVVAPASTPQAGDLRSALEMAGVATDLRYDASFAGMDVSDLLGRVVLDPECFMDINQADPHGGSCVYLDSQIAIEDNLGRGAITPTDITVTCPLVHLQP